MRPLLLAGLLAWAGAGRARAQEPEAPPAQLLNLMEADLSSRRELRDLASGLSATFQVLTRRPPKPGTTDARARAPASEGGEGLMAVCSGSFLPDWRAATAGHCIGREGEALALRLVLRRHLFRVRGGRLVRVGYEDYAITGRILARNGDLVILEVVRPSGAPGPATFRLPDPGYPYPRGAVLHSLGYPSSDYGVPFLSSGCRITLPGTRGARGGAVYESDCPTEGGMSGGPQFLPTGGVQVGIVSETRELNGKTVTTSPLITAAVPPSP